MNIRKTLMTIPFFVVIGCSMTQPIEQSQGPRYFTHKVSYNGETLGAIAAWYTGSIHNWQKILSHNQGLQVSKMKIGDIVQIPEQMLKKTTAFPKSAIISPKPVVVAKQETIQIQEDVKAAIEPPAAEEAKVSNTSNPNPAPIPAPEAKPVSLKNNAVNQAPAVLPAKFSAESPKTFFSLFQVSQKLDTEQER